MNEHTEMLIVRSILDWQNYQYNNLHTYMLESVLEQRRQSDALELLAEHIKYVSWLAALMLGLLIGALLILILFSLNIITLFEDGSIQFFRHAGWGFCLFPSGGCS